MTPQHTPGPWSVADGSATGFKTASGGENILANARPTDDFFILKIAEMETNVSEAERAANARLISAAPDLLALLQELSAMARLPSGASRSSRVTYPAATFYRINAAIAKATGADQ